MLKTVIKNSALAASLALSHSATAAPDLNALEQCFKQRGRVSDTTRLACYDTAFTEPEPAKAPAQNAEHSHLQNLWRAQESAGKNGSAFRQYKQNYLLPFTNTHTPNQQPRGNQSDRNDDNSRALESAELKFQFSLKSRLPFTASGSHHGWWIAYTQQSHWQLYDTKNSRPFRETNYEPEGIYSYDLSHLSGTLWPLKPQFLNIGVVHQSNGQDLPRSRSWNRVYAQLGMESRVGSGNLAVLVRPWLRFPERRDDDNPDILRKLGHGDLEVKYWLGDKTYSLIARQRAIQLDLAIPYMPTGFHLQYFNGYGQSLIDYNHRQQTLGLGFSLPYGF